MTDNDSEREIAEFRDHFRRFVMGKGWLSGRGTVRTSSLRSSVKREGNRDVANEL